LSDVFLMVRVELWVGDKTTQLKSPAHCPKAGDMASTQHPGHVKSTLTAARALARFLTVP
jgi:hypothetical protein